MSIHNLKIAYRNLTENKFITGINIVGLTVAMTVTIFIFSFARKENTTDHFLLGYDNIYGLQINEGASISQPMVNVLRNKIPEIEAITHFHAEWAPQVFVENEGQDKFKMEKLMVADSAFFKVLQFEALWGNPQEALNKTNQLVLTQSFAKKVFGNENPVGRAVRFYSTYLTNETVEVGAVIKDIPNNSSWDFEGILSLQTNYNIKWYDNTRQQWGSHNYNAYLKTIPGANIDNVEAKLNTIFKAEATEEYSDIVEVSCLPYHEVYFNKPDYSDQKHGNQFTLSVINIVGLLILLLACFNYINLVTAQREKRNKIIGIVKALGSNRAKIIQLLAAESALVLLITALLVVVCVVALVPTFNSLTGSTFTFQKLLGGWNLVLLMGILLVSFVLTGVMPGLVYSQYNATLLLKPALQKQRRNVLRNGFLVFQFVISIALMACVITINRQSSFITGFDTGFLKQNIIYASTSKAISTRIDGFTNELQKINGITDLTFSEQPIGFIDQNWGMRMYIKGEKKDVNYAKMSVSSNFFDFFGIDILRGKTFADNGFEKREFIFNQTFFKEYGLENLSDGRVKYEDDKSRGKIVAEVADFHFESIHTPIRPIGFMHAGKVDEVLYLKISGEDYVDFQQTISAIENSWNQFSPHFPFEFKFLNDSWNTLYVKDQQFMRILSYTTVLSILLSCLGLIGLTFFVIENYTKEIGIRKVNGATVSEILTLLNLDFIKWVAIAFVIACPIAWFAMHKWLSHFAYKTALSWWIFALAGGLALVVALLTVSFQSWKAASRNPVEALKYE